MCSAPDNKCKDREPPLSPFAMSLSHRPSKLSTDVPSSRLARRKYNTLSLNPRRGHMVQNAEASSDWNRLPASMPASTQPRSSRNNPPLRPPSTTTSQTNISQKTADDIEHLRSKHKPAMAQDHTRLVEAPQPNITALHATLATPPKTSASTTLPIPPIVLGKSNLIRDNLLFLPDGAYFLHISRVKRALENAMDSDEGVAWITRYPEAPRMASKINEVLEDMSHCVKRSELDFGAREWVVWRSLDRAVERRRMEELRKPR